MYTKKLLLPMPYGISPVSVYFHSKIFIRGVLNELTSEEKNQDLMQTDTGRLIIKYRQLVVGEFYRQIIDNKFAKWNVDKILKPIIMPEVDLWKSVYQMLEKMSNLNSFATHPAHLLRELVEEGDLMVFIATYSGGKLRVKKYLALRQHQNRELQGCENPFDREESPHTWKIMDLAIKLANVDDEFRKRFYMPVVVARQKITAFMKKDRIRIYFKGKLQRQGRKKESISQKGYLVRVTKEKSLSR
ncbi:hypothetical protein ACN23B_17575 [Anabaena sp. FACHB-709]|uniref:Uncharacterized protein n=2 Tax=Nostocaceae TaxID=1162 RepID=A0A1Z4KJH2_ANAVA|nr:MULTISPECIES: hypothetical protein [Nostocaceae]BAY69128.1 hypothetical protein NIES23_19190 [Trichormus variabilis NIES-23]HBW32956.1 hypothetical protein [Nostoc sp. UBA8866]MBD2174275.1 hypothetical protein [Anabaena cylindrica FACHB-318]MBD2263619.1 hypothetical protein [Anabaena sp. FACHB-709]MBD2275909.1 hypothetical protein [Nostoc sp. PCC 7120 = FACHB-418]